MTEAKTEPDWTQAEPLLSARHLHVTYQTEEAAVPAVRDVSFDLYPGEVMAIVGESGAGKSTVARAILRLLPGNASMSGTITYRDRDLTAMTEDDLRRVRGAEIGLIFQDGLAALTPTMRIGDQIAEVFEEHRGLKRREAFEAAVEVLAEVFPDARRIADSYTSQISGGMAQRVMIALATAMQPSVILADEPTANLDPVIRDQMLRSLEELRDGGTSILAITHDFGVVARLADRVGVMYAGTLVEQADVRTTFRTPKHPYTFGLLSSIPSLTRTGPLVAMRGQPPDLARLRDECTFLPRCTKAIGVCRTSGEPPLIPVEESVPGHAVRCYNPMVVPFRD